MISILRKSWPIVSVTVANVTISGVKSGDVLYKTNSSCRSSKFKLSKTTGYLSMKNSIDEISASVLNLSAASLFKTCLVVKPINNWFCVS